MMMGPNILLRQATHQSAQLSRSSAAQNTRIFASAKCIHRWYACNASKRMRSNGMTCLSQTRSISWEREKNDLFASSELFIKQLETIDATEWGGIVVFVEEKSVLNTEYQRFMNYWREIWMCLQSFQEWCPLELYSRWPYSLCSSLTTSSNVRLCCPRPRTTTTKSPRSWTTP